MEECEMKNPFTPLILESFWKNYTLYGYYTLTSPNNLVGWYVKYIWYVEKYQTYHMILPCVVASSSLLTISNIKNSKNKNKIKINGLNMSILKF